MTQNPIYRFPYSLYKVIAIMILCCAQFYAHSQVTTITSCTPLLGKPGDTVMIVGTNFNTTADSNVVFIGPTKAKVATATSTLLKVAIDTGNNFSSISVTNLRTQLTAYSNFMFSPNYINSYFLTDSFNFKPRIDYTTDGASNTVFNVTLGDLDGDGRTDILVNRNTADTSSGIYIFRNTSTPGSINSSSLASPIFYRARAGCYNVKVADIDGDGKLDVLTANKRSRNYSIFRNISTVGTIALDTRIDSSSSTTADTSDPTVLTLADFDQDGRIDIAFSGQFYSKMAVVRNISSPGTIRMEPPIFFNTDIEPLTITSADFNNDGRPDIALACTTSTSIYIYKNNITSTGSFSSSSFAIADTLITGIRPSDIAIGDLDGDNLLDVVATNANSSTFSVFKNISSGSTLNFNSAVNFLSARGPGGTPSGVCLTDLNGDGKLDIIVNNAVTATTVLYKNTISGTGSFSASSFQLKEVFSTDAFPYGNTCGDIDGDTYPDIVVGNNRAGTISIFRNYPLPAIHPIIGRGRICFAGDTTQLTDSTAGGTWISTNTSVATITSSGLVTSRGPGLDTIFYRMVRGGDTNYVFKLVQVDSTPVLPNIVGVDTLCLGTNTAFSNDTLSGTWTSSDTTVATISSTGFIRSRTLGLTTITYTYNNSCGTTNTTKTLRVINAPTLGAITGPDTLCVGSGSAITLANSTSGGTWTSSNTARATVTSAGLVTGITAGSVIISYAVSNSCGTTRTTHLLFIDVVSGITGASTLCQRDSTLLVDTAAGGTWSTSNASIATVSSIGRVYGVAGGSVVISYSYVNACGAVHATQNMTINPLPNPGTITGPAGVCSIGSTITLSSTGAGGGAWSVASSAIGTIHPTTGAITSVAFGTTTVTYTATNGCGSQFATRSYAVSVIPPVAGAIFGVTTLCAGGDTTLLSDTTVGGVWSSLHPTLATVGSTSGIVTGVAEGIATIKFVITNGCGADSNTTNVSIRPLPNVGAITGPTTLCLGDTAAFSDTSLGGTWRLSNALASIVSTSSGSSRIRGVSLGTDTLFYSITNSCGSDTTIAVLTIAPLANAGAISGRSVLCIGDTTSLRTSGSSGGVWSSLSTTLATISGTGLVTALATGTANLRYIHTNSCGSDTADWTITISPLPVVGRITGAHSLCLGTTTTLTDSSTSGVWTSSNATIASVSGGLVRGNSVGTAIITFTKTTSCGAARDTFAVTVLPLPNAGTVSGTSPLCEGLSSTYASTGTTGGTWQSGNSSIATVTSAGLVHAVAAGTTTIKYFHSNSCGLDSAQRTLVVSAQPNAGTITPASSTLCLGDSVAYTASISGHTWSVTNTTLARISSAGLLRTLAVGIDTVYYIATNSCGADTASANVTINPLPNAGSITGTDNTCVGGTISLSASGSTGGTWSSSVASVATVSSTGTVSAVSAGTTTIKYRVTNSCGADSTTFIFSVLPLPTVGNITGANSVCQGDTIRLNNTEAGGSWSTSSAAVATINSTGLLRGVGAGTTIVTYSVTNSCGTATDTALITVRALPNAGTITGAHSLCISTSTSYSTTGTTGTWSTSNAAVASVNTTGTVTAVSVGAAIISYSVTNSCGTATDTQIINILSLPASSTISGTDSVCVGASITWSSSITTGLTWSSSDATIATITGGGIITGRAAGTATISATITNSCGTNVSSATVRVLARPTLGAIVGVSNLCLGTTGMYSDSVSGGTWTLSDTTTARLGAITASNAEVLATAVGTTILTYTATNSCGTVNEIKRISILPLPEAGRIIGVSTLCQGSRIRLTNSITGGVWSATNTRATVDTLGNILGINTGTDSIIYTFTNSCGIDTAMHIITILPTPDAGTISGPVGLCIANNITLVSTISGGSWSISPVSVATISSTGIITGVTAGVAVASYTISNSCGIDTSFYNITVNPQPRLSSTLTPAAVCDSTAFSYLPTSAASTATFTWSRSTFAGIANAAKTGIGNILDTLHNTTALPVVISYQITINANGCLNTQSISLTIKPTPTMQTALSDTVCSGSRWIYIPSSLTPGTNFSWSRPAVAHISPATNIGLDQVREVLNSDTLEPVMVTYVYTLNADGCAHTDLITLQVDPIAPTPKITTHPNSIACTEEQYQNFGAANLPPAGVRYVWTATSGTNVWATGSTQQYALVNFMKKGGHWVYLMAQLTNSSCLSKDSFFVAVQPTPDYHPEVIYYKKSLICLRNDMQHYQWGYDDAQTLDSTLLSGETNQNYYLPNPDWINKRYWVMTNLNDCEQKTYYTIPTSIEPTEGTSYGMRVYPNPTNGVCKITLSSALQEQAQITVLSITGQTVHTTVIATNGEQELQLDLPAGIYLIKAQTAKELYNSKIVIER